MSAKQWEKLAAQMVANPNLLSGVAILPIEPSQHQLPPTTPNNLPPQPRPTTSTTTPTHHLNTPQPRPIHAQKNLSLKAAEAAALVDAVLHGRAHRDYVYAGGQQYIITTVLPSSYCGRCTSTASASGIVLVKTGRLLLVGVYSEPVTAAQAFPYVHKMADELIYSSAPTRA